MALQPLYLQPSIDTWQCSELARGVEPSRLPLRPHHPLVVGSFGTADALEKLAPERVEAACDLIEVRLDLLSADERRLRNWQRFEKLPVLFTARRASEGGSGDLDARARMALLNEILDDAALIDIEVASIPEMGALITELAAHELPWIASFHDFHGIPEIAQLHAAKEAARHAGAAGFKAAFAMDWQLDRLPSLGQFIVGSDFPVALMGMGPFAPISRVTFAQFGSVLNYGYLGDTPTAPGQWSAAQLRQAIQSVQSYPVS
ncbi:3-dehydroquinate dehydratase type I [Haloferula luteola]|uniref:3-dehydroquinate dehydratase n=1 Tax=Haloferula luteola TaxID=595692 RepID=A0A840VGH6_9BACT|nr:type I 3-dehydroquinate dehydratase [Haloferula luteola]MBB5351891.1 3-dehydroquinate dehydratase type I [Haloferula luteola]